MNDHLTDLIQLVVCWSPKPVMQVRFLQSVLVAMLPRKRVNRQDNYLAVVVFLFLLSMCEGC